MAIFITSNKDRYGKRPLPCDIIKRSASYIKYLDFINGTIANSVIDYELSSDDQNNIISLVRNFTPFFKASNNYLVPQNKNEIKIKVIDLYDSIWKSDVTKLSKSDLFLLFKNNTRFEKYIDVLKNPCHRIALSRLRLSSH